MDKDNKKMTPNQIAREREKHFRDDDKNPNQLPLIANEIQARVRNIKREIYKIGSLLTDAKKLLDHGEFQPWIEANFDFSYQTANNFRHVFECCLGRPHLTETIKASILYQIAAPNFPDDLREHLLSHGTNLKDIKNKKMKRVMKRYRKGEIDLDSPEIEDLIDYRKSKDDWKRYHAKLIDSIESLSKLRNTVVKTVDNINWPTKGRKNKVKATEEIASNIRDLFSDIDKAISNIRPKIRIVKSMKPKLKQTRKQ